jgi:hypothetical protein
MLLKAARAGLLTEVTPFRRGALARRQALIMQKILNSELRKRVNLERIMEEFHKRLKEQTWMEEATVNTEGYSSKH